MRSDLGRSFRDNRCPTPRQRRNAAPFGIRSLGSNNVQLADGPRRCPNADSRANGDWPRCADLDDKVSLVASRRSILAVSQAPPQDEFTLAVRRKAHRGDEVTMTT